MKKTVDQLTVDDLEAFAVWEYTNADEDIDETVVRPIRKTPVKSLDGRLVGTRVILANGSSRWAAIGNVDPRNSRSTQHFLVLSVFDHGKRFTMARYHDVDRTKRGPRALARFLHLPIDQVFPISYDITQYCTGEAAALTGTIEREPRERWTRAQLMALAVR